MKKTITYKEIKDKVLDIINNGGGGGGKSKLSELNDVTITSVSDGQVLKYNGTKWVNGVGGGSVKSFTFTSDGTVGESIEIPSDVTYILGIRSFKANGDEISYSGFPVVDGLGSSAGSYNANASASLTIGFSITNKSMVINYGADAGAKLYDNGQVSTFYYI